MAHRAQLVIDERGDARGVRGGAREHDEADAQSLAALEHEVGGLNVKLEVLRGGGAREAGEAGERGARASGG